MGLGYSGDDVVIKFALDMDDLKTDLKKLQSVVEKSFENMEKQAKENAEQIEDVFDRNFEQMEKEAKGSVKSINAKLGSIGSGTKGLIKAFGRVGGAITSAFSVYAVAGFGKSIIEAAADLEAMEAAFEQVFVTKTGDYTGQATKNLEKMCKEWDMELNTLKGDYSSFAAQFKGLGMDMKDSMESSDTALRLAADAAAMFNIPMKDAIDHVRSFVKGNYVGGESIQIFGSQAMLASYAVEQGIIKEEKAFKELTEAQKQMIRLDFAKHQYDLAGTTGQAAREADMYANQLTKLTQKWTDFKAALGEEAMKGLVGIFQDLSGALESINTEKIGAFFGDLLRLGGEGLGAFIENLTTWINSVNWELFSIFLEEIIEDVKTFGTDLAEGLWTSLEPAVGAFVKIWDKIWGIDEQDLSNMDATNQALYRLQPMFQWLADHGEEVGKGIGAIVKAMGAWKIFKLELQIGTTLLDIFNKGVGAWLAEKIGGKFVTSAGLEGAAGATTASGASVIGTILGGVFAVNYTLAIGWIIKETTPEEANKNTKKRNKAKANAQLSPDKELNGGKNYDWSNSPVTKAWNKFWKTNEETQRTTLETMNTNSNTWLSGFSNNWDTTWTTAESNQRTHGTTMKKEGTGFWSSFGSLWNGGWSATEQSQRDTGTTMEKNGKGFWSRFGSTWSTGWNTTANTQRTTSTTMKQNNAGLWNEISNSKWGKKLGTMCSNTKKSWSTWGSDIKKNWGGVKKEWGKFWDGISNSKFGKGFKSFLNGIIGSLNSGIKNFLTGINSIIKGVNWVYKKISGKKKGLIGEINVDKWKVPKLAKGTNDWQGGTALVGEAGRELVSDPKLGTFMASQPMILPLSKGAAVLRNSKTERLLRNMGISAYAKGKDEGMFDGLLDSIGGLWDYITNPKKLWEDMLEKMGLDFGDNPIISGLESGIKRIFSADFLKDKISKWFDEFGMSFDFDGTASEAQAKEWIKKGLAIAGIKEGSDGYNAWFTGLLKMAKMESGYDPNIVNRWDDNWKAGHPSAGFLQFIEPTFKSHAKKGYTDWMNPIHQVIADVDYIKDRYGSIYNVPGLKAMRKGGRYVGYANGGIVDRPTYGVFGEAGTEAFVPLSNARALKPFGQSVVNALNDDGAISSGGGVYEFTIPVNIDGRQVAIATATFTKEELDKMEKQQGRRYGKR